MDRETGPYPYICPICRESLMRVERSLQCANGHSFDISREGYVNLLAGKPLGALVGDSAEMVAARRAFLDTGHYRPLADLLGEIVAETKPRVVADFGCGEGYYLGELAGRAKLSGAQLYGTDVSKPAIVTAAKRVAGGRFAVADTNRFIPLPNGSVDLGLCIFAPRNAAEFARVVRPGGQLVVVIPAPQHLASLRERFSLLGIEADKPAKIVAQLSNFASRGTQVIRVPLQLDEPALRSLIMMTPNARHRELPLPAGGAEIFETTAEFEIMRFERAL